MESRVEDEFSDYHTYRGQDERRTRANEMAAPFDHECDPDQ